jgi:preprotein translocase subunit SecB
MAIKYYLGEMIPDIDIRAVSRVTQHLNLEEIYLLEAKIESDSTTRSPKGAELDYKFDTEIMSNENNILSIKCTFMVMAHRKQVPEKSLMRIEATFVLQYSFEDDKKLSTDDIDIFAKINPLYNAWPYWREFVQNLTSKMGFPALTIPILRFEMTKSETEKPKQAKPKTAKRKSPINIAK